ncbi:hypothetical protein MMC07_008419 [Pseudocyphellaria aurata]|nr:hypothetical protein [Pseudocyphellaria aurata]
MANINRKNASETQAQGAFGPSLLDLPIEVRFMIYHLVLVADKTLGSGAGLEIDGSGFEWARSEEYGLQPAILRVCWQMHREASPILYGQNTFGLQICGWEDEDEFDDQSGYGSSELVTETKILLMHYALNTGFHRIPSIDKFQKLQIVIDTEHIESNYDITDVCYTISGHMRALKHISIHLLEGSRDNHLFLKPFGMLRNIPSVVLHGVPLPYAERLKGLMLGNTPVIDEMTEQEMFRMLLRYVHQPNGSDSDLDLAAKALEEWDYQKFKEIRSKIISDGPIYLEDARRQVFAYDPRSDEDDHAATEENDDNDSEEGHESTVEEHDGYIEKRHEGKLGNS